MAFLTVNNSQQSPKIQDKTKQEELEFSTEAQKADRQIREYYQNLGNYSAPSMDNICDLYNSGLQKEGKFFHGQHMSFCDLYGNAALAFGSVLRNSATKTVNDIKNAVDNVKTATEKATNGLRTLIQKEEAVIEANSEPTDEKMSEERERQSLSGTKETTEEQDNSNLNEDVSDRQKTKTTVKKILGNVNMDFSSLPEELQEDLVNKYTNMVNFAKSNDLRYYNTDTLSERLVRYAQAKLGYTTKKSTAYLKQCDAESLRKDYNSNLRIGKNESIQSYYERLEAEKKTRLK